MITHAAQAACVSLVSLVWTFGLLAAMYAWRDELAAVNHPLALPSLCLACTAVFLVITVVLVMRYGSPDVPLVTAFGLHWFTFGWTGELVFMGVRIDSPVSYGLILNYQIARCVLGSLLSNAFQPYVLALQSKLLSSEVKNPHRLLVARLFTDVYGFVSGLTDIILYMSQIDIFLVSGAVTMLTNYLCTLLLFVTVDKTTRRKTVYKKKAEELAQDLESKTHPQALLIGSAWGGPVRL
jgi:hypothetical protein